MFLSTVRIYCELVLDTQTSLDNKVQQLPSETHYSLPTTVSRTITECLLMWVMLNYMMNSPLVSETCEIPDWITSSLYSNKAAFSMNLFTIAAIKFKWVLSG